MWHSLEIKEIFRELKTSENGLNAEEAEKRLVKFGPNELPREKRLTAFKIFLRQFKNPLIFVLLFAALVSLFSGHFTDFLIILVVVAISTLVGFFQENKANQAVTKLRELVKYKAKVIRNGREKVVPIEELVPGDVIILAPGDKVPADARLFELHNLEVIEAALTGESVPSGKHGMVLPKETPLADRENMVYMGTVVAKGKATAVVVETGHRSELGRIVTLVKETPEEQTPLQNQILHFSKVLGLIILGVVLVIFFLGSLTGRSIFEMFLISVAIAVAAIPEGLLPALTVILAISMQKILKCKGLTRKMVAAETLGSVSVICSDKTGTLTEGEMRVAHILVQGKKFGETNSEKEKLFLLKIGLLCNNAVVENPEDELHEWKILADPTEKALFFAGVQAGLRKDVLEKEMPRLEEIPFDTEYKFMATLHEVQDRKTEKPKDRKTEKLKNLKIIYVKGAPEKILAMASYIDVDGISQKMTEANRKEIQEQLTQLVSRGLRCLALGYKPADQKLQTLTHNDLKDLIFVGLVALKDPLRPEARQAIANCQSAGIKPVIVTGDHKLTAQAIVSELGIKVKEENILEGKELDRLTDDELVEKVRDIVIYARVEPKHKLRIVKAWQKQGEVVAMTGDGVNDAPALKSADVGVALGSGTDVAKETSDLILLDNNFNIIVEAVRRGRITFDNIRKVILYLLTDASTAMTLVGGAIILGLPLPLLPAQILWIKLAESSLPAMALATDEIDENVMQVKPRKKTDHILNKPMKQLIVFYALIMDLTLFILFYYFWKLSGDLGLARTIAFVGLGMNAFFYAFAVRGYKTPIYKMNPFENRFLILALLLGLIIIQIAIYVPFFNNNILHTVPLGIKEWIVLGFYALLSVIVYEIGKRFTIIKVAKQGEK